MRGHRPLFVEECRMVTSVFLCACESWTLTAELQRGVLAKEMRGYSKILCILYKIPCYRRGSLCQDPAGNRTTRKPGRRAEAQTEVV